MQCCHTEGFKCNAVKLTHMAHAQEALQTEKARLQLLLAKEEQSASAAEAQHTMLVNNARQEEEKEDELDAFMGQVAVQLEHDKVRHIFI